MDQHLEIIKTYKFQIKEIVLRVSILLTKTLNINLTMQNLGRNTLAQSPIVVVFLFVNGKYGVWNSKTIMVNEKFKKSLLYREKFDW